MAVAAAVGAGMLMKGVGSLMAGQGESDALNYQANIQEHNAMEAHQAARFNAMKQGMMATKVIGSEKAGYGASGVSATSGSVLSTIAAAISNAEMDRMNIIHGGDIRAVNYENQASLDKVAAGNALKGSYFSALGSVFQGGAELAGLNTGGAPKTPTENPLEGYSGYEEMGDASRGLSPGEVQS